MTHEAGGARARRGVAEQQQARRRAVQQQRAVAQPAQRRHCAAAHHAIQYTCIQNNETYNGRTGDFLLDTVAI